MLGCGIVLLSLETSCNSLYINKYLLIIIWFRTASTSQSLFPFLHSVEFHNSAKRERDDAEF